MNLLVPLHRAGAAAADVPNPGARGAIAGVLRAHMALLPGASVLTLVVFALFPNPAIVLLPMCLALRRAQATVTHPQAGGSVAFLSHGAGFRCAVAFGRLRGVRPPLGPGW
jgi:hypothetical protein